MLDILVSKHVPCKVVSGRQLLPWISTEINPFPKRPILDLPKC